MAERKTVYIAEEFIPAYDYAISEGKKENRSASETVMLALRTYACFCRANIRMTDGVFFALRDGAFDLIEPRFSENGAVLMLTREGDMRYASEVERNREIFEGKRKAYQQPAVGLSCVGAELISVLDFKEKLIRAFAQHQICSLSEYNAKLADCTDANDIVSLGNYVVYIDEANAYFRTFPEGNVIKDSSINNRNGFVMTVDSVYNDFPTVEIHIVEENSRPIGFDVVRKSNPTIVEFSYRVDSDLSANIKFDFV